jgi:hypothetical protein
MSSKPYPGGVAEVVKLLTEVDALDAEAATLRPHARRLSEVESQAETLRRRLPELLRSMDVESPGNYGWERRMGWFLAEMRRQLLSGSRYEVCRICGANRANHSPEYWDEHQRAAALDQ